MNNNNTITIEDDIFTDNNKAIDFCLQTNILKSFLNCRGCGSRMHLKKNKRKLNEKEYVCTNRSCKKTKNINDGFVFSFPN